MLLYPIISYRKYISFAPSPSRANAYFRKQERLFNSVVDISPGQRKNEQLKDVAVATHQRQSASRKPACFKITSMRKVQSISKKHISYIHLLTSCSNLTQLSSSSPILKTICVSTRYHPSAYSTSISHLVSFYSILNQSFSSLLSSNHTIFPCTLSCNRLNEDLDHSYLVRHPI